MDKMMSVKQNVQDKVLEYAIMASTMMGKISDKFFAAMVGLYVSIYTIMPAVAKTAAATSNEITNGISEGTEALWRILVAIVAPVGAVALAIQAVKILWGGQRAAEEAKSTAIKIIIAIAVVLLAPAIIRVIRGWFKEADWKFT